MKVSACWVKNPIYFKRCFKRVTASPVTLPVLHPRHSPSTYPEHWHALRSSPIHAFSKKMRKLEKVWKSGTRLPLWLERASFRWGHRSLRVGSLALRGENERSLLLKLVFSWRKTPNEGVTGNNIGRCYSMDKLKPEIQHKYLSMLIINKSLWKAECCPSFTDSKWKPHTFT